MRALAIACWTVAVLVSGSAGSAQADDEDCLVCHEDLEDDEGRRIGEDLAGIGDSIHGDLGFACVDCHVDVADLDGDHAEELEPAACGDCHEAGEDLAAGAHPELACEECHGSAHAIVSSDDGDSPVGHFRVSETCASCHERLGDGTKHYADSVHGLALSRKGLKDAPSCVTCHGVHDIRTETDPDSSIHRVRVADMCGECHAGLAPDFEASVHAELDPDTGEPRAVCSDCHSSHDAGSADLPAWRQAVVAECGECHEDMQATFSDGFHGKATLLGFDRVARCSDCHGFHDIRAIDDPLSRVAKANVVETCRSCHEKATDNWSSYDPHADLTTAERNPQAYWAKRLMIALLAFVFSFFFVHTALWLPRSLAAVRAARSSEQGASRRDAEP